MSPLTEPTRIVLRNGWQPMDPDAAAYITAVETADGQALEEPVKIAIDNFVLGCKADSIWDAIKASCILAGARTLAGALVPLAGAAPTNYNFVAGDYNRKTGLIGDGSSKYLDSNRNNNADPQNSNHNAVFASTVGYNVFMGASSPLGSGQNVLAVTFGPRNRSTGNLALPAFAPGFIGTNRSQSTSFSVRCNNSTIDSGVVSSAPPDSESINIFRRNVIGSPAYGSHRLAFYSIGEALDLALLDARVTDLINKFAEVIP